MGGDRAQVEQMARTFIAGASIADATPVLKQLWMGGKAWSVDLLGEATIKTHVARVLMKLGLRNRVQAVVFAYESGLVEPRAYTT